MTARNMTKAVRTKQPKKTEPVLNADQQELLELANKIKVQVDADEYDDQDKAKAMLERLIRKIKGEKDVELIGWKSAVAFQNGKAISKCIVKLTIPADADRVINGGGTNKSRAEYAKVEAIYAIGKYTKPLENVIALSEHHGDYDYFDEHDGNRSTEQPAVYIPGQMVYPDGWDSDQEDDCTHGIHFFTTAHQAEQWAD